MKFLPPLLLLPFLLLAACAEENAQNDKVIGRENFQTIMVSGKKVEHPAHGLETWFALGAMNGVNGVAANGMGQSHVFEDGATIASINLNIVEAPKGFLYVGWLTKGDSGERIRLGALENPLGDARHQVIADIEQDLTGVMGLLVTKEGQSGPKDGDPVIAEGTMKERSR